MNYKGNKTTDILGKFCWMFISDIDEALRIIPSNISLLWITVKMEVVKLCYSRIPTKKMFYWLKDAGNLVLIFFFAVDVEMRLFEREKI